jgi:hypothetical protein
VHIREFEHRCNLDPRHEFETGLATGGRGFATGSGRIVIGDAQRKNPARAARPTSSAGRRARRTPGVVPKIDQCRVPDGGVDGPERLRSRGTVLRIQPEMRALLRANSRRSASLRNPRSVAVTFTKKREPRSQRMPMSSLLIVT